MTCVAFSPDGRTLASASWDQTVKLWDVASGRELKTLSGHAGKVTSVAFSPDGKALASGGADKTIKLWDLASGAGPRTLAGHADEVSSLAFSPDGKTLASGGHDDTVKLWDLAGGGETRTLTEQTGQINAVAFSPDGKILASASFNTTIKLWDGASGAPLRTLMGHTTALFAVAFSPDGKVLASVGGDHTVKLWDLAKGIGLSTLIGHGAAIRSLAFSPDGKVLASASADKTVKLWDVSGDVFGAGGKLLRTLTGHEAMVFSVAFSPDGKTLASGGWDHAIKLWDVASGRELRTLTGHAKEVNCVAFSPDAKVLASASMDDTVRLWDAVSGREIRAIPAGHLTASSLAFAPDGKTLAAGAGDGTITLWDTASGEERRALSGHTAPVFSLAFSPDGQTLASAGSDQTIRPWDLAGGRQPHIMASDVQAVAFSPDGKVLASAGLDGTTRLWDASSGEERVALMVFMHGADLNDSILALTPGGYFDASSARAEDYLNVRIGDRVFAIGSYREKFYRPSLVMRALSGGSLAGLESIASEKLPPVVEFVGLPSTTSEAKLKITLRLTDSGGGVGLVRVFLNGSAIIQDNTKTPSGGAILRTYIVPLLDGPNALRAVAFTADGSVQSNDATGAVTANLPPAPSGTLFAIVVGIKDFPKSPQNNLTNPVVDAQLIADTLRTYSASLFQKLDIRLLTTPAQTDKEHVVRALEAMRSAVGPGDEFVFFVASHGIVADGVYYLVTSNVGGDPTRLKLDAISRSELAGLLANIPATMKLAVIDTCHAGAMGEAKGMDTRTAAVILGNGLNLTVLAAATTDQEAIDSYQGHGLFTFVVADGLRGGAADADNGIVDNFQLAHYVGKRVRPLAINLYQHEQVPTVIANGEAFAITKAR